jgi:hypothetical protein
VSRLRQSRTSPSAINVNLSVNSGLSTNTTSPTRPANHPATAVPFMWPSAAITTRGWRVGIMTFERTSHVREHLGLQHPSLAVLRAVPALPRPRGTREGRAQHDLFLCQLNIRQVGEGVRRAEYADISYLLHGLGARTLRFFWSCYAASTEALPRTSSARARDMVSRGGLDAMRMLSRGSCGSSSYRSIFGKEGHVTQRACGPVWETGESRLQRARGNVNSFIDRKPRRH